MEWISVKEKLPEAGQKILVSGNGEKGRYWAEAEYFSQIGHEPRFDEPYYGQENSNSFGNVTHWAIPDLPKTD